MSEIAVIMSVYTNDKLTYVQKALESIYDQTKKVDIFIQQDGNILYELENYLDKEFGEQRIVYLGKRNYNIGLAGSLNELLTIVLPNYEYIVRMDADDISVADRIQKQVDFMEKNRDIQVLGGWIEEFNMDTDNHQTIKYEETCEGIKKSLLKRNPIAHVTVCFRHSFFDIISGYNTTMKNEDFDMWIRALKKDVKFHNLQEILVRVRTNNAFFNRRKEINRAKEVMLLKIDATRTFGFGLQGYIFAIAHFLLFMSPSWLKKIIYKNLRG